jgi:hypothetical protein
MLGTTVAPGHIRNTLPGTSITFGELDSDRSERLDRLQQAFERAGVTARISPDIISARWERVMLVGPWSAISAVTRAPLGVVRSMSETRQLLEGTMREVLAVSVSAVVPLTVSATASSACRGVIASWSSMATTLSACACSACFWRTPAMTLAPRDFAANTAVRPTLPRAGPRGLPRGWHRLFSFDFCFSFSFSCSLPMGLSLFGSHPG